jgi:hypothetical protein
MGLITLRHKTELQLPTGEPGAFDLALSPQSSVLPAIPRWLCSILVLCFLTLAQLPGILLAQATGRTAVEQAATQSAVRALLDQVRSAWPGPNIVVNRLTSPTSGDNDLASIFSQIAPLGGPRWLDEQTCQVRLEISGAQVADDLRQIAAARAWPAPVATDEFKSSWFSATGAATFAGVAPQPPPGSEWANIPGDLRRQTVQSAALHAAEEALARIGPIELAPGRRISAALTDRIARKAVLDWLINRPVIAIDYQPPTPGGLALEVTFSADPLEFSDIVRAAVAVPGPRPRTVDPWNAVRDQLIARLGILQGRATIAPFAATQPVAEPISLPATPPDWAATLLDAVGNGPPAASSLRAARLAESEALAQLRRQVLDLPLTPDSTIAQAIAKDPRLSRLVDRAIARGAVLYQTDYHPNGTVTARMSLDLRLIWSALADQP